MISTESTTARETYQDLFKQMASAIQEHLEIKQDLDMDRVCEIIDERVRQATMPKQLEISLPDGKMTKLDGAHCQFEEVVEIISEGQVNILLVGPAGTGKTTLAKHVAKALDVEFGFLSLSAGITETHLFGRWMPNAEGRFEYIMSKFVELYEKPGVYLLDELDAADPNVMVSINAALANGHLVNPVTGVIRRMSKSIMGIADEAEGTTGKLDQIGLKFEDLKGLSPDKQFELIAGKIAEIANPTQRAAAAMSIFGRSGTAIVPMIEDFAELNAEAESLGFIKSSESAKNAKEFANTMMILGKAMKSVATAIGSAVMPVIRPYLQQVIGAAVQARDWLKANQPLIQTIFRIGAAVVAAGTALVALGYAVSYIGKGFGLLAAIVPVIGTALSVVATVIGFLLTPIGAVIGAVAALAGYWAYSSGAMGEAAGWLGEVFDSLRKDALTAFGGVTDALAAGDFGLAAQIAWTQIRLWWEKGTGWISGIWNDAMGWLTQRFYEAVGGWRIIFEEIGHGLTVAWINITAGLSEVWYNFVYGIQVAWNWCGKMLQKAWNTIKGVFDKSFDSEAANKAAEDAYQNKVGELKKEKDGKIAAVEDQYNKEMASEKRLNQDNLQKIVDQTEAAKATDQAQRDAKDAANQKAVDQTIVDRCGSYAEQSISGKGLHILVGGKLPGTGRGDKTVGVEIYATGRLFIVTGRQLDGTPKTITENQATIGYLLRTYFDTQAGPTETTEKTEDMTSVTSATSDTSAVSDHSIVSTFSISSAHSVFSVPSAISVDDIIAETLPKGQGERNECVFNLARGLKFEAGMVNAKFPELKLVVRRWHDQAFATIGTKDFDETWSDFIRAWGVAKVPLHADVVTWALEKAKTGPLPPQAADYDSEMVRFLVGTCFHLASCHPEGRFFLSSHLAGEKLGVTHDRALRSLRMLCADEVIAVVEHGNARWATRYRWMPPVEQGPVSLANSRTGGEAQKNENRATSGLNSNG